MKTCLVTGASGFVGFNLAKRLVADGHSVHVLLRDQYQSWRMREIAERIEIHRTDLLDGPALRTAVKTIRPDWIFHLAAFGAYSWQRDANKILTTNVLGTSNLLNACLSTDFESFVNAGSSSEYGQIKNAPNETARLDPDSHYAVAKAAASHLCRHTAISTGLHVVTLRLYSVFGPYEDPHRLLPAMVVQGLQKRLPKLVSPEIARDFVYVEDVVEAFILAATAEKKGLGEIYNVGTGVQTTIQDVATVAKEEFGITDDPVWHTMQDRPWDTTTWVCDNSHIKAELGWTPKIDFRTGFRCMAKWFMEHPQIIDFYIAQRSSRSYEKRF